MLPSGGLDAGCAGGVGSVDGSDLVERKMREGSIWKGVRGGGV